MNFYKISKNIRKINKNAKAISPVISVLLMIAVAVVASLVVYAWVMGYVGFQTSKTGEAVQVQSVSFTGPGGYINGVYLQNLGTTTVTVVYGQSLYVNGVLDPTATVNGGTSNYALQAGSTVKIVPSSTTPLISGTMVTVKVTTQGGTYSQITQQVP